MHVILGHTRPPARPPEWCQFADSLTGCWCHRGPATRSVLYHSSGKSLCMSHPQFKLSKFSFPSLLFPSLLFPSLFSLLFLLLSSPLYFSQESVGLMGVLEGGMVKEGETGDVSKFLNRILGLKVHQQNLVRGCGRGVVSRTANNQPLFSSPDFCLFL